jgi:uncharacterized glyoxalase superfamily protein PhnB
MSTQAQVREGQHTVTPYLIVVGAAALIDFLVAAFDATVLMHEKREDGSVMHASVRIGDSTVMLADAREKWPAMPTHIFLLVDDCDATHRRALEVGGVSEMEPTDQPYGDRMGGVKDASGNYWWVTMAIDGLKE